MKKKIGLVILIAVVTALGCGKSETPAPEIVEDSNDIVEVPTPEVAEDSSEINETPAPEIDTVVEETASPAEEEMTGTPDPNVDLDLTVLSSTMVYSQVFNMMVAPDDFVGKKIKMEGQFVPYYDEATGNYYFACFISDATACCSQGIEFILDGDYTYPDDYPQEDENICVVGTFDTYLEDGIKYVTLRHASFA